MWVWADHLDVPRPNTGHSRGGEEVEPEGVAPQLYNLDAVAYESLMLGLFCIWRGVPKEYPARDKINEVCLGFSRDGFHWDRPSREAHRVRVRGTPATGTTATCSRPAVVVWSSGDKLVLLRERSDVA